MGAVKGGADGGGRGDEDHAGRQADRRTRSIHADRKIRESESTERETAQRDGGREREGGREGSMQAGRHAVGGKWSKPAHQAMQLAAMQSAASGQKPHSKWS